MKKTIGDRVNDLEVQLMYMDNIDDVSILSAKIQRIEGILEKLGYDILIPNKIKRRHR